MALCMQWFVRCGRPEDADWRECNARAQAALDRLLLNIVAVRPSAVTRGEKVRFIYRSELYPSLDGANCYAFTLDGMQYYEYDNSDHRVRALWKTAFSGLKRACKQPGAECSSTLPSASEDSAEYERLLARRLRERLQTFA
jgi:hypothetical protein